MSYEDDEKALEALLGRVAYVQETGDWDEVPDPDAEEVAKGGRLDWSPKENWVERSGGLPRYIEDIALALIRERGMKREHAIPVAINRVKLWARGGDDVEPDTRAKAAKAVAEWTALKARNKG